MQLPITALYAGLLAIFALYLSFQAGTFRGKSGVILLHGDPVNWELTEKVRRHQNFLEYVPMLLILMGLIEINGGSIMFIHVVGVLLILARIAHATGLRHDSMSSPGRTIGAAGTALLTLVTAGYTIWIAAGALM